MRALARRWAQAGMLPRSPVGTLAQLPFWALMGWARGRVSWVCSQGTQGSHTVHPVARRWARAPSCADLLRSQPALCSSDWQRLNLPEPQSFVSTDLEPKGCPWGLVSSSCCVGPVLVAGIIHGGVGGRSSGLLQSLAWCLGPGACRGRRGGERKGQRAHASPPPGGRAGPGQLTRHFRPTVTLRLLSLSHHSCPEERTGCPGRWCWWAKCQHTPAPALERELPVPGPEVLWPGVQS